MQGGLSSFLSLVRDTVRELALGSSWASDTRSFGGTIKRCATDGAAVLMLTSHTNVVSSFVTLGLFYLIFFLYKYSS